jgi:hypothetical protein
MWCRDAILCVSGYTRLFASLDLHTGRRKVLRLYNLIPFFMTPKA